MLRIALIATVLVQLSEAKDAEKIAKLQKKLVALLENYAVDSPEAISGAAHYIREVMLGHDIPFLPEPLESRLEALILEKVKTAID